MAMLNLRHPGEILRDRLGRGLIMRRQRQQLPSRNNGSINHQGIDHT